MAPRRRTSEDNQGFGLGVVQLDSPSLGKIWFYQGTTLGYRVIHVYVPTTGVVLAIGVNSQPSDSENHVNQLTETIFTTLHEFGAG